VLNDKNSFKIVKYFSPHCQFCRYLKQVVDKLKHEKQWCFNIFDLNCAWYPQHCSQYVRSASFPYTAIHNADGELHEEIHGFYPEPVIRTIFDRIEQQCIEATKPKPAQEIASTPPQTNS
jgi:thioredoxin-like negative regulator of GroEL